MGMSIRRLSPAIGAEVTNVDITRPLETVDSLKLALAEHCVLLIRNADITPEQHLAFSRYFGSLERHLLAEFSLAADYDFSVRRHMHRTTIAGDAPY